MPDAHRGRRDRGHVPRARSRARARRSDERDHGGDVRQGHRVQQGSRRLDAPLRRRRRASTAATPSSAAACPSRWASRSPTRCWGVARVTACFFGDGAVEEGEFHESMNLAALWKLPVLFLCENNLYAMGTAHRADARRSRTLRRASARSYAMPRPSGGRHGRARRAGRRARRDRGRAPGRGPRFLELRHVPLSRALDVRRRALPRQGRGRRVARARPHRAAHRSSLVAAALRRRGDRRACEAEIEREVDAAVATSPRRGRGSRSRT